MSWIRLGLAGGLFAGFAVWTVLRVPHGVLWKPAVVALEWGHFLAPIVLLLAAAPAAGAIRTVSAAGWPSLLGADTPSRVATGVFLVCAGLLLTPWLRAAAFAPSVEPALVAGLRRPLFVPEGSLTGPLRLGRVFGLGGDPEPPRALDLGGGRNADIYGARPGERRPLLVVVHGGSWNSGDRTQLPEMNRYLAAHGWVVAAVEYRWAPGAVAPAQADDVRAAVELLASKADSYGIDRSAVALYGRSAGAQLVLQVAYEAAKEGWGRRYLGVVALYPPADLPWSWDHPSHRFILDSPKTLSEYLGAPGDVAPEKYAAASPWHLASSNAPPTLLIHGTRDELVWAEQSRRMHAQLDVLGVPNVLIELPWATHGFEANLAGPSGQLTTFAVERFLATAKEMRTSE